MLGLFLKLVCLHFLLLLFFSRLLRMLVPAKKLQPLLRFDMVWDIVIFQYADGPIHFEHSEGSIFNTCDAVLTEGPQQLIHGAMLLGPMGFNHLPAVNQNRRVALDCLAETPVESGNLR